MKRIGCICTPEGSNTIMVSCKDGTGVLAVSWPSTQACAAGGITETHNTRDEMNSNFFAMKAGTKINNVPFVSDYAYQYYHLYVISPTQNLADHWTATGRGS